MATFTLNFTGLCHFVENIDESADVKMCVVMPDASGEDIAPAHICKLFILGGNTNVAGKTQDSWIYFLRRQRVTFEFYRDRELLPSGVDDFEFGAEGKRGVILMEEIAGIFADQNLDVMAAVPPSSVQAHILLERGEFKASDDYTLWFIPGTLTGSVYGIKKKVANGLYLEVDDVDWVRVRIDPFEPLSPLLSLPSGKPSGITQDLYPDENDSIMLYASNDCNTQEALEILTEANQKSDPTDFDFRYHFQLLNDATMSAIERVVDELPLPKRLSPEPATSKTADDLRKLFLPHLSGAEPSQEHQNISRQQLIDKLVRILITLLTNGCNCLRGGGTARLFDLEYFTPSSAADRSALTQLKSSKTTGKKGV